MILLKAIVLARASQSVNYSKPPPAAVTKEYYKTQQNWLPFVIKSFKKAFIGTWRSLVAHLHGVQGVGGSNPLVPTI
tara:strand:+ start:8201 stop:8431 length:231 start_codon:yes stop_codon:yes gene_type:complete